MAADNTYSLLSIPTHPSLSLSFFLNRTSFQNSEFVSIDTRTINHSIPSKRRMIIHNYKEEDQTNTKENDCYPN